VPGAWCLVLVTSRRRLKGLDDAFALPLDVLPQEDAVRLLRAVAGPGRVPVNDPVATEIVELCGRLPLAVRIAGALLRHRRAWSPEHLAGLLRDQSQRLAALADGERDLGAVFDLSYHGLTDAQRSLYRSLGRNPGPDFDAYAVAALTGTDPATATRLLEELVDHNLVINHSLSRYRLHDLIRAHARTQSAHDSAADRESAVDRLLDYYQHTAARADALIARRGRSALAGFVPAHAPALPDPETARVWLRTERANLFSALQYAADAACEERIVALTSGLAGLLRTDGPWTQAITLHTASATVAERLGDRSGQANALMESGVVRRLTNDHAGAMRDLEAALDLHRDLGDRLGQAHTMTFLGGVRRLIGDFPGAVRDLGAALDLHRDLGDGFGQANTLVLLGNMRGLIGDHAGAVRDVEAALDLHRDLGNRLGQANAMATLGIVRSGTGDFPGAMRDLEAALGLYRDLGVRGSEVWALNHYAAVFTATGDHARAFSLYRVSLDLARETRQPDEQAFALGGIGECHLHTGDTENGTTHLTQALEIFQRLGMTPDADRVRARLDSVTSGAAQKA
jgi:tetratricopeptide (TPR) repeat protein